MKRKGRNRLEESGGGEEKALFVCFRVVLELLEQSYMEQQRRLRQCNKEAMNNISKPKEQAVYVCTENIRVYPGIK